MTSRDFCYWLKGFLEISEDHSVSAKQLEMIEKHLDMVFLHEIDPSHGPPKHQEELSNVHTGAIKLRC